jgi:E3 ubiquitin-protein ligase MARCH6
MTHGWTRPDPVSATKEVIGPLAGGLLGMIFSPGLVFRTVQYFLPNVSLDNRFMCKLLILNNIRGFRTQQ